MINIYIYNIYYNIVPKNKLNNAKDSELYHWSE